MSENKAAVTSPMPSLHIPPVKFKDGQVVESKHELMIVIGSAMVSKVAGQSRTLTREYLCQPTVGDEGYQPGASGWFNGDDLQTLDDASGELSHRAARLHVQPDDKN